MTCTVVTKQCPFTGVNNTLEIPLAPEVYLNCFMQWQSGSLIQEAFPMLSPDYREFIMTGITPEMWDAMFTDGEAHL